MDNGKVKEVLYRLNVDAEISADLLGGAFEQVLNCSDPKIRDVQIGSILTGLMSRRPTKDQVVALLNACFKLDNFDVNSRRSLDLPGNEHLICSVGSGKKGYKTINVSTPALLIASTLGVYTAKPASTSTSSMTGSADFLREVGFNLNISQDEMCKVITHTRFGAFSIESLLPKFDSIYGGRFYVPHTLSFGLAALASPVKFDHMVYGLAHPNVELSAEVLKEYGVKNAMIVASTYDNIHYIDEVGVNGAARVIGIKNGNVGEMKLFDPVEALGIPRYSIESISQGATVRENVQYAIDVLAGKGQSAHEDIVCINAGTVLYVAGRSETVREGYLAAKDVVKTGLPLEKLIEVINASNGDKTRLKEYL